MNRCAGASACDPRIGSVARDPSLIFRPWQHVIEPLAGYLALTKRLLLQGRAFGEAWNFGQTPIPFNPAQPGG